MPALETITGVPIARVGVWETSTGRWVCTREQLEDAIRASRDPSFRKGVLKIGHTDPRFNGPDGADMDGQPAVGRLENYRLDASGDVLLADLVGVPKWLAEVLNSAYPSRSIEASLGVVTADGNAYALVVTGLALLGETPPAIESLADVAALYEQPTDVDTWVAAARVAASIDRNGAVMTTTSDGGTRSGGNQGPPRSATTHAPGPEGTLLASATIDELVTQAAGFAAANGVEYPWVREVYTDRVIVSSDAPPLGRLWELTWAEAGDTITFGGPYPVKIEYTRLADTPVAAAAHRTIVPVRCLWGRGDASTSIPEEQSPVSDLAAQVRERLGLPPDATDEQVTAALDSRLGEAPQPEGTPQTPTTTSPPAPEGDAGTSVPAATDNENVDASALERLVRERVEAATAPLREVLASTTRELADRRERERVTHREELLASARNAGKITPADVDKYRAMYDKGPEHAAAVEDLFSTIAASSRIPVAAAGHTGGAEPSQEGFDDAAYYALFPDEKQKGAGV